jgi:hypothetical protein
MSRKTGKPSYALTRSTRRQRLAVPIVVVAVGLVAAAGGGAIGFAVGKPNATEAGIAELRQAEAARDVSQIKELTTLARATRDQIGPALEGVRADDALARAQDQKRIAQWQQTIRQAVSAFESPPSGTTATNVARGALRGAVEQAALAVDTYAAAAALPADRRQPLVALASRQSIAAATMWSVAATQLDQINIDAGHGHQHVFLNIEGGHGAFTEDGAKEGTGG